MSTEVMNISVTSRHDLDRLKVVRQSYVYLPGTVFSHVRAAQNQVKINQLNHRDTTTDDLLIGISR